MKILRIPNGGFDGRILASHHYIGDKRIRQELSSDMFQFLDSAYRYIGGFKSFTGEDDFVDSSYLWYVTYDGPLDDDMSDFDINKVYTVAVFKQKFGLKLVGAGNNRFYTIEDKNKRTAMKKRAKSALLQQMGWSLKHSWMEVSGSIEDLIKNNFPADKYYISPEFLMENHIFSNMEIDKNDPTHYTRTLSSGLKVTKIAYGKIDVNKRRRN